MQADIPHSKAKRNIVFYHSILPLISLFSFVLEWDNLDLLFGFNGISPFVDYLTPNPFYVNNQFYFKQFSLAWVHSLIVKNISISNYLVYSNSSNSDNSV